MRVQRMIPIVFFFAAGCAARSKVPLEKETQARPGSQVVGWRLSERSYGSIDDPWARAGDARILADQVALVYEPVYREERIVVAGLVTERTACAHRATVEYDGPSSRNVGDVVAVQVFVDGPSDVGHLLELAGSNPFVTVVGVEGATPLSGQANRYVLAPGARAIVKFTSRIEGRACLKVSVVTEMECEGGAIRLLRR